MARYCMLAFNDENVKLKSLLFENKHMISLIIDTCTSIQNVNYMCMTNHYI